MDMDVDIEDLSAAAEEASALLKSLSNPVRLRILCLITGREVFVGELCEALEISQSLASQHLTLLRKDGLVTTRREGQTIWYSLADERVIRVMEALQEIFCPPKKQASGARVAPRTTKATKARKNR